MPEILRYEMLSLREKEEYEHIIGIMYSGSVKMRKIYDDVYSPAGAVKDILTMGMYRLKKLVDAIFVTLNGIFGSDEHLQKGIKLREEFLNEMIVKHKCGNVDRKSFETAELSFLKRRG
jgi:hypothetical protein